MMRLRMGWKSSRANQIAKEAPIDAPLLDRIMRGFERTDEAPLGVLRALVAQGVIVNPLGLDI